MIETEKRVGPDGVCHLRIMHPVKACTYVCGLFVDQGDVPLGDDNDVTCGGCLKALGRSEERKPVETIG